MSDLTHAMTETPPRLTLRCQFCDTWNRIDADRASDRPKCGSCGRPILLDRPWILTADSFDRTIAETDVPVLVDFYADWCGPCRALAPVIDRVAKAYMGRVRVAKLDIDASSKLTSAYDIRSIPTLVVFKNGRAVARIVGGASPAQRERGE